LVLVAVKLNVSTAAAPLLGMKVIAVIAPFCGHENAPFT
jgi:hypothetical protein